MTHSGRFARVADGRGFTITEFLVAAALFLIVALATYSAFSASNKVYGRGEAAAEMQQRTRLAFDQVMTELRLAGFDHDRDGEENGYPNHPDEQVEFIGAHALTFRANLDADDGNGGREPDLELDSDDPDFGILCCPIVTTGNDEIVTFALRSNDETANTGSITFKVDLSAPRDAGWDEDGALVGEEEVVIEDVDLTDDHPPYTLVRFSVDALGAVVETPIATDLRTVSFTYASADGTDFYCADPEDDGSCLGGNQATFSDLGGSDDIADGDGKAREARAALRRIDFEMVGMTELDDTQFMDADDTLMPHRRKLALTATVAPPNLGLRGRPDLDDEESFAPTNVTACGGQCGTIRVEWDEADRALSYKVNLYVAGSTEAFFSNVTPGVQIPDSDPPRVYAIYQRLDSSTIQEGASIIAKVQSRLTGDEYSEESEASDAAAVEDLVRLEAPQDLVGTGYDPAGVGWPDVLSGELLPDTANESGYGAEVNQITISWVPPSWVLDVTDEDDLTTWTTQVNDSTHAPLECDSEMADIDGDTVVDKPRTRAREMFGDIRYFVFRSTNPRFVPTSSDLIASIPGTMDTETGRVSYTDTTQHYWRSGIFNYSVSSLENCKTYYYRVRAVDDCYDGTNPASFEDLHLSPFHPPLNTASNAVDSDDFDGVADDEIGLAIPGYAIPQAAPRPPAGARFSNLDRSTADGDGLDATICFDAVKLDSHTILGPDSTQVPDYKDIVVSEYRVYSSPNENFNLNDALNGTDDTRLEKTIRVSAVNAGRIAYDDENADGTVSRSEDETESDGTIPTGAGPRTALRITTTGSPRWYKVLAVHCTDEETVPSEADPDSYDIGGLSRGVKYPCDFGGGAYSVIACNASAFPTSVTATAYTENVLQPAKKARLVLLDPTTGDRAVTPLPGINVNASGVAVFSTADIASLTDNFGNGTYRISVEMTDSVGCIGVSNSDDQTPMLPTCCLAKSTPYFVKWRTGDWIDVKVRETCGAASMRINKITLDIDNTNKGQPERFTRVLWGTTLLWTGSNRTVTIDTSASPLIVGPYSEKTLSALMSRDPRGDVVTVTYEYRIGGLLGTCTFVQSNTQ